MASLSRTLIVGSLIACTFAPRLSAQEHPNEQGPRNLDFEHGGISRQFLPQEWCIGNPRFGGDSGASVVSNNANDVFDGANALRLQSTPHENSIVSQSFDATPYRGRVVTFAMRARLKSDDGAGMIWMLVEHSGAILHYENSGPRSINSFRWKPYNLTCLIDSGATTITIGCSASEGGCALFDNASFEVSAPGTPLSIDHASVDYGYIDYLDDNGVHKSVRYDDISRVVGSTMGGFLLMRDGRRLNFAGVPYWLLDKLGN